MDKLRAEFEKWLEETHGLYGEDVEWQQGRNCYAKFGIHLAYQAWKQSRASIVVDCEEPDSYLTADGTRLAYKAHIRSIGLSIKGE